MSLSCPLTPGHKGKQSGVSKHGTPLLNNHNEKPKNHKNHFLLPTLVFSLKRTSAKLTWTVTFPPHHRPKRFSRLASTPFAAWQARHLPLGKHAICRLANTPFLSVISNPFRHRIQVEALLPCNHPSLVMKFPRAYLQQHPLGTGIKSLT